MGMCSNVKKSPQKNEIENTVKADKNNTEKAASKTGNKIIPIPLEEEFKDMEEWEGVGIKCLKGYKCIMLIDDLMKFRDKFWSIFNFLILAKKILQSEIWKVIKLACTVDENRSETILKQYSLKMCNGKINELIDAKNRLYKVPNFCINLPYFEKTLLGEEENHSKKKLNIFLHDVYDNKKVCIELTDDITILEIKKIYAENNSINLNEVKLRFLYGGSELNDEKFLYQYNIFNDYIVQILKINLL